MIDWTLIKEAAMVVGVLLAVVLLFWGVSAWERYRHTPLAEAAAPQPCRCECVCQPEGGRK